MKAVVSIFNATNASHSDIEYYFSSRLRDEPLEGVEDIHFHPTLPRTFRVAMNVSF